jgi:hypothetical protein
MHKLHLEKQRRLHEQRKEMILLQQEAARKAREPTPEQRRQQLYKAIEHMAYFAEHKETREQTEANEREYQRKRQVGDMLLAQANLVKVAMHNSHEMLKAMLERKEETDECD